MRFSYDPGTLAVSLRAVGDAGGGIVPCGTDGRGTLTLALASVVPLVAHDRPVLPLGFDAPNPGSDAPVARLLRAAVSEIPVGSGD